MGRGSPLLDDPANRAAYAALAGALRDGSALALVGAGSSARVGYPLWGGLLSLLEAKIREEQPLAERELLALAEEQDSLWRAERYRALLGPDGYEPLMRETFGPREPAFDAFHEDLVRLPFRHVLTTNYDPVLEHAHVASFNDPAVVVAWTNRADVNELIRRAGDAKLGRRYVYLHGRYNDPAALVLTERDYTDRYTKEADTWPKLFALLATQRVVSVGFSLEDLDLMGVFRSVKAQLGPGRPAHFAILAGDEGKDLSTRRERLRVKYGVAPVFYRWTKDHAGLQELVRRLLEETARPAPAPRNRVADGAGRPGGSAEGPLPSIEGILDGGPAGEREYPRLMHALLATYAAKHQFTYEVHPLIGYRPKPVYSDLDAVAAEGLPGFDGPTAFLFRLARERDGAEPLDVTLNRPPNASIAIGIKHCVLVTSAEISTSKWRALEAMNPGVELHVWGMDRIEEMLRLCPPLLARYYPRHAQALIPGYDGFDFEVFARSYREKVAAYHERLTTIGLPPETLRQHDARPEIELRKVFVPLRLLPEGAGDKHRSLADILSARRSAVILGDPGAGKSTLLKFLCLLLADPAHVTGIDPRPDAIPLFVPLRDFVRLRKEKGRTDLTILDYLEDRARADLQLGSAHRAFFEAALRMGEAVVLFDGLDEVGREAGRQRVTRMIEAFCRDYPRCTVWGTSRVYGYTRDVRLSSKEFAHYRIGRLELEQIDDFVARWHAIQLQVSPRERAERSESLRAAIRRTPSVQRLAGNPLLLTLMAFIHHGLKRLPQDRGELYEKCVEMLLKTWQEARRGEDGAPALGARAPALHLHTQKDYLAHLALRIQERNQDGADEEARGVIPRAQALDCLTARHLENARRARPDLTPELSREEMAGFLDHVGDETGLLVDRGGDHLSFIHLSFQEYLAAWVYTCAPERVAEQPAFFEARLGVPAWEEVLLLRLYVMLRTPGGGGSTLVDAVVGAMRRSLSQRDAPEAWLTLARALRDNIELAASDVAAIVAEAVERWASSPELEGPWFTTLEDIVLFGGTAKGAILACLRQAWERDGEPERAVACLHLAERLFGFPRDAAAALDARADLAALVPGLIAFTDVPAVAQLLGRRASVAGWIEALRAHEGTEVYELSLAMTTTPHPAGASGEAHRAGLAWLAGKIAIDLASRAAFASRHASGDAEDLVQHASRLLVRGAFHELEVPFSATRAPASPLGLPVAPAPHDQEQAPHPLAISKDRLSAGRPGVIVDAAVASASAFIGSALQQFLTDGTTSDETGGVLARSFIRHFVYDFGQAVARLLVRFRHHPHARAHDRSYDRRFVRHFVRDFGETFASIGRDFVRDFVRVFGRKFVRAFGLDFARDFGRAVGNNFRRIFGIDPDAADATEAWERRISTEDGVMRVLAHPTFWDVFVLRRAAVEVDVSRGPATIAGRLYNPLALPLLMLNLWTTLAANHLLASLRHMVVLFPESDAEGEAWAAWLQRHHIAVYQTAFAWEEHAKAFSLTQPRLAGPRGALLLAHAAYAGLMTGLECQAPAWQDLLAARDQDDPLIRFAHLLYEIAHFRDGEANARALDALRASPPPELAPILEAAGLASPPGTG